VCRTLKKERKRLLKRLPRERSPLQERRVGSGIVATLATDICSVLSLHQSQKGTNGAKERPVWPDREGETRREDHLHLRIPLWRCIGSHPPFILTSKGRGKTSSTDPNLAKELIPSLQLGPNRARMRVTR